MWIRVIAAASSVLITACAPQASLQPAMPERPATPGTPYSLTPSQLAVAKDAVAYLMKDPGSAQFRNVRAMDRAGSVSVCGEVNAKNSYGGYGGFNPFTVYFDPATNRASGATVSSDNDGRAQAFILAKCA